jgi:hypothetical protein
LPVFDGLSFSNATGSAAQLAWPPIHDISASLSGGIDGAHVILPDQRLFARTVSERKIPIQDVDVVKRKRQSKRKDCSINSVKRNTRPTRSVTKNSSRIAIGLQKTTRGNTASSSRGPSRAVLTRAADSLTDKTEIGQEHGVLTRHGAKFREQKKADASAQCGSAVPGFDDDNESNDESNDDDGADDDDSVEGDEDWNVTS